MNNFEIAINRAIQTIKNHTHDFPYITHKEIATILSLIPASEYTRIKRLQTLKQELSPTEEEIVVLHDLCTELEKNIPPKGHEHLMTILRELIQHESKIISDSAKAILKSLQEELKQAVLDYMVTLKRAFQHEAYPLRLLPLLYQTEIDSPIQFVGLVNYLICQRFTPIEEIASSGLLHYYFKINIAYQENIKQAYSLFSEDDPETKKLLNIVSHHSAGLRGQENIALDASISDTPLDTLQMNEPHLAITISKKNLEGIYSVTGNVFLVHLLYKFLFNRATSNSLLHPNLTRTVPKEFCKECIKIMTLEQIGMLCQTILQQKTDANDRKIIFALLNDYITPEKIALLIQQKPVSRWWLLCVNVELAKARLNPLDAIEQWLANNPLSSDTVYIACTLAENLTDTESKKLIHRACFDFYLNHPDVDIYTLVQSRISPIANRDYRPWYDEQENNFTQTLRACIENNIPLTPDSYINIMDIFYEHKKKLSVMRALSGLEHFGVNAYPTDKYCVYREIIDQSAKKQDFNFQQLLEIVNPGHQVDYMTERKRTLFKCFFGIPTNYVLDKLYAQEVSKYYPDPFTMPLPLEERDKITQDKLDNTALWKISLLKHYLIQETTDNLQNEIIKFIFYNNKNAWYTTVVQLSTDNVSIPDAALAYGNITLFKKYLQTGNNKTALLDSVIKRFSLKTYLSFAPNGLLVTVLEKNPVALSAVLEQFSEKQRLQLVINQDGMNEFDLHILDDFPETSEMESYKNNYMFLSAYEALYYIKPNGVLEKLHVNEKFSSELKDKKDQGVTKMPLTRAQVQNHIRSTNLPLLAKTPAAFNIIMTGLSEEMQEVIFIKSIADENLLDLIESMELAQYDKTLLNKIYEIGLRVLLDARGPMREYVIKKILDVLLQTKTAAEISSQLNDSQRYSILKVDDLEYTLPFVIPFVKSNIHLCNILEKVAYQGLITSVLHRKDITEMVPRLIKSYQDLLYILNSLRRYEAHHEASKYILDIINSLPQGFIVQLKNTEKISTEEGWLMNMPELEPILIQLHKEHPDNQMIEICLDMLTDSACALAVSKLHERGDLGHLVIEEIKCLRKGCQSQWPCWHGASEKLKKIVDATSQMYCKETTELLKGSTIDKNSIENEMYQILSDGNSQLSQALNISLATVNGHPPDQVTLNKIQEGIAKYAQNRPASK